MTTVLTHPATVSDDLLTALRKRFDIPAFRPLQREALEANLTGRDSLLVMPTGSGKSFCYQAPAVARKGLTVVVSPLIALMEDQCRALDLLNISAGCLHSGMLTGAQQVVESGVGRGLCRVLYVAPERLASPACLTLLAQVERLDAFVIDEAHCISSWGHDFRPAYRALHKLRVLFPQVPLHAFTATATERVRTDIVEQLQLRHPFIGVGDFDRPNLTLRVVRRTRGDRQVVTAVCAHGPSSRGIVYCNRRADTERLVEAFTAAKVSALAYHAGLAAGVRYGVQRAFTEGRDQVIVATVAFGMGINVPDVRFVLHSRMPDSLERYHQEIGRAGRDGKPAECVLLFHPSDVTEWRELLDDRAHDQAPHTGALVALEEMIDWCRAPDCRRRGLLRYFGQTYAQEHCDACDVCLSSPTGAPCHVASETTKTRWLGTRRSRGTS